MKAERTESRNARRVANGDVDLWSEVIDLDLDLDDQCEQLQQVLHSALAQDIRRAEMTREQLESRKHVTFVSDNGLDVAFNCVLASDANLNDESATTPLQRADLERDGRLNYRQKIGTVGEFNSASYMDAKRTKLRAEEVIGVDLEMFGALERSDTVRQLSTLGFLARHIENDKLRQFHRLPKRHLKPFRLENERVVDGVADRLDLSKLPSPKDSEQIVVSDEPQMARAKQRRNAHRQVRQLCQAKKDALLQIYVSLAYLFRFTH